VPAGFKNVHENIFAAITEKANQGGKKIARGKKEKNIPA
jgi:hypothetical protein